MTADRDAAPNASPFLHVLLMTVPPAEYERIVRETSTDVRRLATNLAGLVRAEVYGSDDRREVLILSGWTDAKSWAHAEWDPGVQDLVVDRFKDAQSVHSKLYHRIEPNG